MEQGGGEFGWTPRGNPGATDREIHRIGLIAAVWAPVAAIALRVAPRKVMRWEGLHAPTAY